MNFLKGCFVFLVILFYPFGLAKEYVFLFILGRLFSYVFIICLCVGSCWLSIVGLVVFFIL